MTETTLPALFRACRACREHPVFRTRQKAIGARPALAWHQCCAAHVPGARLAEAPAAVQAMAARLDAHETVAL